MDDENGHEASLPSSPTSDAIIMDSIGEVEAPGSALPPPRLMITKMEIENFKSYAGVKQIGPFHKCFSSVVGPNGSGKSNVIDAMLFVFGKRAKKLRLNKVSELIHKSDAVKDNPPQSARVSVFFQEIIDTQDDKDSNSFTVVPNSQHVVTRIARKDNSSVYKLDGKVCQFKQVAEYLGSKGIDLDNNRFLILQGEVEMISMMPPKGKTDQDEGLLEYLEDIIGSSKFVEETNEAAAQVESLTQVWQDKLNRVKAVQKEKDSLESAKQEAEALLTKEREIRRKQNILYQIHVMNATKEQEKNESKRQEASERLAAEREKLNMASERLDELDKRLSEQRNEYELVHDELKTTKEEFTAYERRDIKLKEEIKHEKSQVKKLQAKIETEIANEENAVTKGREAEESIPVLTERISEIKEKKIKEDAKLEEIFDEMKEKTQELRSQLEQKTEELAPVQQEKAVFQNNLDTAETEVKLIEGSANQSKEKLKEAEEELSSLDEKKQLKQEELASAKDELARSTERIKAAELEEIQLKSKESQLLSKTKELMERTEIAKAALNSQGSRRSKAVDGILKASQKGGELAKYGILGRLGDLATISEQYDIAVSTACGMLDHIVVQTTAGAQKCLDFLRKHNLGRANFIPLDKMAKGAHDRSVETPENAPRLFDLISPTTCAVAPAIFLGVGNTLVAPDLDVATRWAYDYNKRWRVVTLDGKLIETAGTMSGGGTSVRRGGMKLRNARSLSSSSAEADSEVYDCQKLEAETEQAQQLLQECRNRRKDLVEEIRALKKRVKALEVVLPKLTIDLSGFENTRDALTRRIPELRSQCELSAEDTVRVIELKKVVEKRKADMASCALIAQELEVEVDRLQKAILDVGGPKLKKQQAACDKLLNHIKDTEKALNTARISIKTSEKAVKKAKTAKSVAERELEECQLKLATKQEERKSLANDAVKVSQAFEEVKVLEAKKREALEEATKECEAIRKSQSAVKVAEIELVAHLENCENQLADCRRKRAHWTQLIEKLKQASSDDEDIMDLSDDEDEDKEPAPDQATNLVDDKEAAIAEKDALSPIERKSSLLILPFSVLEKYSVDEVQCAINVLEKERSTVAKNANMGAIAEYRKKEVDYLHRVSELDSVTGERNAARKRHEDLRRMRLEMFMDGFGKITLKLKEMYQMITLGGDAELELVDSLDPFSEGIVFSVRPPKKSWKNISNLSGGEKTLSSLALVFALHHFRPTPLYVMDEIDAALDFKNVSIVANYIKDRTKNAQFIIISLRNNMFELADRLVGIYKTNNCTNSVTINPASFGVAGQQNGFIPRTPVLSEKTNRQERFAARSGDLH